MDNIKQDTCVIESIETKELFSILSIILNDPKKKEDLMNDIEETFTKF